APPRRSPRTRRGRARPEWPVPSDASSPLVAGSTPGRRVGTGTHLCTLRDAFRATVGRIALARGDRIRCRPGGAGMDFANRTVVVTGAAGSLGRAVAAAFA